VDHRVLAGELVWIFCNTAMRIDPLRCPRRRSASLHKHQACQVKFMLRIRALTSLDRCQTWSLAPKWCECARCHANAVR
jgi:hypothetical protein